MSVKVNKKSVRQMGGGSEQSSMIPPASGMQEPQQLQVDPAIQQISMFFSEAIEKGGKPEEIVMGLMQQNVDQETIGQALMMMGYEQEDVVSLFEQVNLLANATPADAQQVNQNPQELARNQALAEKQKEAPVKTEPMVEEVSEEVMMAKSGIEIKKENRGKFTKWAKARGMGVQEAARKVLANKDRYPASVVKMANFARNAAGWKKEEGGEFKPHMMYKGNKAVKANTYEEHLALGEQGFVHKDELKKANYGREFLPSGVASASNAVPFDLNVDLGAYTSLDGDIDFPMFGVEGDPSGSIIRPQMQAGPGTDGGVDTDEITTNNDDANANNSGDPSNNEEIVTTESITTSSPSWIKDAISEGGNPLESENYKMMLDFMKKANTNVNVNTGNEEVDDPNIVNDKGSVISGNNVYLPPNLYSQGSNFSLGNAFNSVMRVGNNLFSGKDLDGDGLKDGVLRGWKDKAIQNKINKYKNATYNVDVDLSEENVNQAGVALQKFLYENPTADDQYDAVGNVINKGLEDNNIPISTDDIDPTTAEKFKDFLSKGTDNLSEAALKTYNALKEKLGYEYGGSIPKMQQAGETQISFQDWVLQDPVNRSGANAQAEYDAFIAENTLPDFSESGGTPPDNNTNDGSAGSTDNPGVTALDPSIDKDQDGIPDTIDVDAGDGTGVGGSFQDAYDKINMPTITPDFGGVEGALTRGYNSNLVKGFEGISGGIIDLTANIFNPIFDDKKQKDAEANLRSQVVADNIYDTQVDPFNSRGKNDINRGTSGSEGDRTTGLYLTQGRLAKAGGESLPKAQTGIGGGGGSQVLLNTLPNLIFKDPLGKKLLNFDEETAEDFVGVYDRAMKIGESDDVVGEGISFFQDFSKEDLKTFLGEAGISKDEVRNYVYDQDWFNDMNWATRQAVKLAMKTKGLKKGGETVNVDSATLAKLIAAGADIEML